MNKKGEFTTFTELHLIRKKKMKEFLILSTGVRHHAYEDIVSPSKGVMSPKGPEEES